MSATLTPSEKRTITRRANKAKREANATAHCGKRAAHAGAPAHRDLETKVLDVIAVLRAGRAARNPNAAAAASQGNRRELAGRSVVSLAEWRAFVLPPPTHIKGKPVPPPKPPGGPPPAA
jgi:hypothetical protein